MNDNVWVVLGQYDGKHYDFKGVYSSKNKAENRVLNLQKIKTYYSKFFIFGTNFDVDIDCQEIWSNSEIKEFLSEIEKKDKETH